LHPTDPTFSIPLKNFPFISAKKTSLAKAALEKPAENTEREREVKSCENLDRLSVLLVSSGEVGPREKDLIFFLSNNFFFFFVFRFRQSSRPSHPFRAQDAAEPINKKSERSRSLNQFGRKHWTVRQRKKIAQKNTFQNQCRRTE
jgi:hypothetical protein